MIADHKITSEELWKDLNKELQRFIFSKVKDKDAANDILQDVFIKIHLNLHKINDLSFSKQWAYSITRNTINDHFRKQKFTIDIDTIDLKEEITVTNNSGMFAKCLQSFIKHLPKKYEEAITLTQLRNLNQLDLSRKLKISYSGAKSRVQRAKELLKKKFYACCPISADKYGNIIAFSGKSACGICKI